MKIWFDVTGIYDWAGNFTGIQRVVYNLGKKLYESDADASFCIYKHGTFHEVSFSELEIRLEKHITDAHAQAAERRRSLGALRHHTIVMLKKSVRGTILEKPSQVTYSGLRKVYRTAKGRRAPAVLDKSIFQGNDIVLIADGNWQFSGFVEAITAAKSKTKFKLVHFVYDLTSVRNPAIVNTGADKIIGGYFKHIFPVCDLLIAISESTKRDIGWFSGAMHIAEPRVEVLILGDDNLAPTKATLKEPSAKFGRPYILAVGTVEIRKNYAALYYAYKLAEQKGVELPHLVIAGRKGWMAEETYSLLTKDRDLKDKITLIQGPSDSELAWLYDHCLFTVFPSFYEGWGFPIAESFAHGKVCIASNTSSTPEVGGELAVYVSPYNPQEVMKAINALCSNNKLIAEKEALIKAKYRPRTWKNVFNDMVQMLGVLS